MSYYHGVWWTAQQPVPDADPFVLVWKVDPVTKRRHSACVRKSEAEREGLERLAF